MSSIKKFYNKHILTLSKKAEQNSSLKLEMDLKKDAKSYFTAPLHADYLYPNNLSLSTKENLEKHLSELWENEPEMQKIIPDLAELAFQLKEEQQEQTAELSPFVYAMF